MCVQHSATLRNSSVHTSMGGPNVENVARQHSEQSEHDDTTTTPAAAGCRVVIAGAPKRGFQPIFGNKDAIDDSFVGTNGNHDSFVCIIVPRWQRYSG